MQESTFTNYDQLPLFLNANTVAQVLGVSISSAYELMHETGFPALEHQASPPVCTSTHRQNFSLGTTMRLPIHSAGKPVSCMSS